MNLADLLLMHVVQRGDRDGCMGEDGDVPSHPRHVEWLKEKFSSFKYIASSISGHVMELEELVMKM